MGACLSFVTFFACLCELVQLNLTVMLSSECNMKSFGERFQSTVIALERGCDQSQAEGKVSILESVHST